MAAADEARRLLAKAAEDEYVLDRLGCNPTVAEAKIAERFRAQQ